MNENLIEHLLVELKGQLVIVVRPMFGTQSDSWTDTLIVHDKEYPLQFEVRGTLFYVSDVSSIESAGEIIRLKGPHEYNEKYETLGKD